MTVWFWTFKRVLKEQEFFISSDNEFHICGRKTLGNCSNTLFGLGETKHGQP